MSVVEDEGNPANASRLAGLDDGGHTTTNPTMINPRGVPLKDPDKGGSSGKESGDKDLGNEGSASNGSGSNDSSYKKSASNKA